LFASNPLVLSPFTDID